MDASIKDRLQRFTMAAKKIIYSKQASTALVQMLNTRDGALKAVAAVLQGIEMHAKIPAQIKTLLAVNIYLVLVDLAQASTGAKANPAMVKQTINALLSQVNQSLQPQRRPQQPAQMQGA